MNTPDTVITVCMGSSCFSHGNNHNVEIVERFLREHDLSARVEVIGCLCDGHCKDGPNIRINGELIRGVEPGMMPDLLSHKLLKGLA
jgi:NADH:ubiquinone oxidoreductase subunit E